MLCCDHVLLHWHNDSIRKHLRIQNLQEVFCVSYKNGNERPILQAPQEVAVAASKSRVVVDDLECLGKDSLPAKVTASSANENAQYLLSSSAYALRKGEGRYQNIMGLVNHVSYGFSNHFSCGIGMFPIFLFEAESSKLHPYG